MDGLIIHEPPEPKFPTMVVAFAGWPDAAEAATRAVRYLVRKLSAKKFAEIDPEEFYDFTVVRPETLINRRGERVTRWPSNDFYYIEPEEESDRLVLYVGTEPNLCWRAFSNIITSVADQCGVKRVLSLGSLLDAVPHTREPRVSGRAGSLELGQKVEWLGIPNSGYQGPTGIHTAFMETCTKKGLEYAMIWGHCPHYVNTSPNPRITHALLTKLRSLVDFDVDLEELRQAAELFDEQLTAQISKHPDTSAYVQRLEQRYDEATEGSPDIPSPDTMVKELEDFLKSQQQHQDNGGAPQS